jgi:hypothetical protein
MERIDKACIPRSTGRYLGMLALSHYGGGYIRIDSEPPGFMGKTLLDRSTIERQPVGLDVITH